MEGIIEGARTQSGNLAFLEFGKKSWCLLKCKFFHFLYSKIFTEKGKGAINKISSKRNCG